MRLRLSFSCVELSCDGVKRSPVVRPISVQPHGANPSHYCAEQATTTGHLPVSRDSRAAEKASRASQNIRRSPRSGAVLLAEQSATAARRQDVAQLPPRLVKPRGEDPNLSQVQHFACRVRDPRANAFTLCGGWRSFQPQKRTN